MKKFVLLLMILAMIFAFTGCGEKKTLTCDHCGADVQVAADSEMTDEWIIYCDECEASLGFNTLVSEE